MEIAPFVKLKCLGLVRLRTQKKKSEWIMVMTPKEKKAFVARMKKGRKAAKGKKKSGGAKKKKGLTYRQTENLEDRIENLEAIIKSREESKFGQISLSTDKEQDEREKILEIVRNPENYDREQVRKILAKYETR